ncbi:unnamed protein product [Rotaria sordida]|uniref:Uncharacterized protein n=1 Tax=Rotaria sordida TaxID=392033 RepID=A0A814JC55_9BILA|nr:unnamed protein product [Rotaria sordida]CAF1402840.1 unnamed protein product [Rotaria sordida]CAF1408272.1 unnamed protein product [Rotaria sordida]
MPLTRPNITIILAYIVIGLTLSAIIFVVLSISTTHWIHTIRMRAGFWKLCHLQPLTCFHSIVRSPAALSLTGLFLIVIGLISTFIFDIIDYRVPPSVRFISLLSIFSLGLGTFFFVMSYVAFSRITAHFCYSYYLMIVGQLLSMGAVIVASYLEGRRNALASTSVIMSRLVVRRP